MMQWQPCRPRPLDPITPPESPAVFMIRCSVTSSRTHDHSLRRFPKYLLCVLLCVLHVAYGNAQDQPQPALTQHYDVVICSASPAGISAALAAASEGCTVLLTDTAPRVGGMLTAGLSHSDFRTFASLTGTFLEFSRRVERHYQQTYGADSAQVQDCFRGTHGEPRVNQLILEQMLAEFPQITVHLQTQLQSVARSANGRRIQSLRFQSLPRSAATSDSPQAIPPAEFSVTCGMAIDASCEGDLLALSGEPWQMGRESAGQYSESLAPAVADQQLQASNFRFILTQDPANRLPLTAPRNYRREHFIDIPAILADRHIRSVFGDPGNCLFKAHQPSLPNGKYDINDVSGGLVRLSIPGLNSRWPVATGIERAEIFAAHLQDQIGLLYFLQHDSQVPESIRREACEWGWCQDEFPETGGQPPELYLREGRRLQGLHISIQRDSEHAPNDARALLHCDSIAVGDYGHNCHGTGREGTRFLGKHTGEFYQQTPPMQIPYGVIVPRHTENLLVPVAVSSSHVGYSALRYEPIRMSLGQAAGFAAAQAIRDQTHVQQLHVPALQLKLISRGSAVLYVSDVAPQHPDFAAVQWWGLLGGLHGLAATPEPAEIRGPRLTGQYFAEFPFHAAELSLPLTAEQAQRWQTIALIAGIPQSELPQVTSQITRGNFIRFVYQHSMQTPPTAGNRTQLPHAAPRFHPAAAPGTHPPGEVDNQQLAALVVRNSELLPGIVVDDCDAHLEGDWQYSTHTPPYVGRGYLHDRNTGKGRKSATYQPSLPTAGWYEVRLSHCHNIRRSTNTLITISHADGETTLRINQQQTPEHAGLFRTLGSFRFNAGQQHWVRIANPDTDGKYVIADAVQWLPTAPQK